MWHIFSTNTLGKCLQTKEWIYDVDTLKPVYDSPVYKRSDSMLWSPENFLKFSVALNFPQSWPTYSRHPVYNGHHAIFQEWLFYTGSGRSRGRAQVAQDPPYL